MNHPEVDYALRTGYPSYTQPEEEYCEICGMNMDSKTVYCDDTFECLCASCLLERHERDAIW